MPLYEYRCEACGSRFELIRKFSESEIDTCVDCGKGPVHRQPSSPAIQFKGSGWYITDYSQKGKPEGDSTTATDGKAATPATGGSAETTAPRAEPAASSPKTGSADT
jgi:putative FmdB family regulatory protein